MLDTAVGVRVLNPADLPAARRIAGVDPIANVFVLSRLEAMDLASPHLGEVWGHRTPGGMTALCYLGANVVPVEADGEAVAAFAERAAAQPRRCSSIVGHAHAVHPFWQRVEASWGPARQIRAAQPVLAIDHDPVSVGADPRVRVVRTSEIETLLPACVAMFTEEVGISPLAADAGQYRARIRDLITTRRAYAWISDGEVVFKAEIGSVANGVCQVQGVWTNPRHRGLGIGTAGMAAVVRLARREIAPVVTLYVNDFNLPARAVYERVGFRQVATFASVLF